MSRESLSTHAIVLRSVPYGDADLVLSLYTRERGRLSAMARSARASRRRFAGSLGLFTLSTVHLSSRPGSELWTLVSAEVVQSFAELAVDMGSFAHASYGTELIRELTPAEVPDEHILELVLELYQALRQGGPSPLVLRAFELGLLGLVGLAPVLERCVSCGARDVDGGGVVLDPNRGGVCCTSCAALSRGVGVRPLSGPARQLLCAAQSVDSLAEARQLASPEGGGGEARDAILALILGHIGKPLRSLEFIAKVSGANRQRQSDS